MLVRIAFVAALTVGVSPLLYGPVLAQVPRIQGQGTAASGMGNAFSAQADDPSALHYNPAGMTQLRGVEFMTGALLSGGTTTFTSPTGVTATGDRDGSLAWPPPTHLYLTANLKDLGIRAFGDLTAGIGVTVPFGSVTRWPNESEANEHDPSSLSDRPIQSVQFYRASVRQTFSQAARRAT